MSCFNEINLSLNPALSAFVESIGQTSPMLIKYLNHAFTIDTTTGKYVPKEDFSEWWTNVAKLKTPLSVDEGNPKVLANNIIKYYRETSNSVSSGARRVTNNIKVTTFGYSDTYSRFRGVRRVADIMLQSFIKTKNDDTSREEKVNIARKQALAVVKKQLRMSLATYLKVNPKSLDSVLVSNSGNAIDKLLGNVIPAHLQNLIALYKELSTGPISVDDTTPNYKNEFFAEVANDQRLMPYFNDTADKDTIDENTGYDEELAELDTSDPDETTKDTDYNSSIRVYNNHMGEYTDYLVHLDDEVKGVLSTLPKFLAYGPNPADKVLNLDDAYQLVELHDARDLATILYHHCNFDDATTMIETLKTVGKNLPGYASLQHLATLLESDDQLKYKFYRTFSKLVIGKLETVVENGQTTHRISNTSSSKLEALSQEYMNQLKFSSIRVDLDFAQSEADSLTSVLKYLDINDTDTVNQYIEYLTTSLSAFYPNISTSVLKSFVYSTRNTIVANQTSNSKDNYIKRNLNNLVKILNNTIEVSRQAEALYRDLQIQRIAVRDKIASYKVNNDTDEISPELLAQSDALRSQTHLTTKLTAPALALAQLLINHTVVRANLNSVNAMGNKSSDVINSSMITNLMNTFNSVLNDQVYNPNAVAEVGKNDTPLGKYGAYKFQSQQYDFSNILVEKKDEKGDIINYGLFRRTEDGKYVPTEYATKLVSFTLFNGVRNLDTGDNVLYASMTKGDFIGTAWANFFNDTDEIKYGDNSLKAASFFLRTPSDAPKTFIMKMPRYSVAGLLSINNEKAIKDAINARSKQIQVSSKETNYWFKDNPIKGLGKQGFTEEQFFEQINSTSENPTVVKLPYGVAEAIRTRVKEGSVVAIHCKYTNEHGDTITYILKGVVNDNNFTNVQFDGFSTITPEEERESSDVVTYIRNLITSKLEKQAKDNGEFAGIKYDYFVNSSHAIVQQLKAGFKQELTNAAVALTTIFDTNDVEVRSDGSKVVRVKRRNGKLVLKQGTNTDHKQLNAHYHFKENKRGESPIWTGEDLNEHLTGKVFSSNKLVVYKEDGTVEKNYGEKIINEAIDFLYKGDNEKEFKLILNADGTVSYELSQEQEAIIDKHIADFVRDLISTSRTRLSKARSFLTVADINDDNIADFMLNYHLAYMTCDDLLEGDSKFYSDSRTFLKRAKEYQGSGVPFGVTNFNAPINEISHINSVLDKTPIGTNPDGSPRYLHLRTGFRAVTIKNSIGHDDATLDNLVNELVRSGMEKEAALDLIKGKKDSKGKRTRGYQNTKNNDAQSFITFEEWIRRVVAKGEFTKYKPLIDKILDENSILTASDITEFIQVQKNFYYDHYYNHQTKVLSPRQIKNAEFVLVPRFIKGTELERVYNLMVKHDIDQLNTAETSKAAQSNVLTLWDNNGKLLDDLSEFEQNADSAKEDFTYNYMYTQQETPQHVHNKNKAGLQIMKKILDNVDEKSPLFGKKSEFFELYAENIRSSFTNLAKELNIPLDENGHIVIENGQVEGINYEKLYQRLKEELIRLGFDSNLEDYITLNGITEKDTVMPNYFSYVASKLENISQSIFNNNITRQTLPGFHAVQITGIGFRKISEQVKTYAYDDKLKYHPVVDGKTQPYIEIKLPASNFGFDKKSKESKIRLQIWYDAARKAGQSIEDAKIYAERKLEEEWLRQLDNEKLSTIIGYRIPTEGKQSICIMKVVGFTDDALGSTIVVPDEWVAQTGSDFDIDSVYGIHYNTYFDKGIIRKIEYIDDYEELYTRYVLRHLSPEDRKQLYEDAKLTKDWFKEIKAKYKNGKEFDEEQFLEEIRQTKKKILLGDLEDVAENLGLETFEEFSKHPLPQLNSRKARENRMLDNMKDILGDISSLEENLSRSNFDDVMDAYDDVAPIEMRKAKDNKSVYNFLDQADFQEDVMSGAKLKAFSVTRDTFCSVCNTVKPKLTSGNTITIRYKVSDLIEGYNKYAESTKKRKLSKLVNTLKTRFGNANVDGDYIVITHNQLGWTNDNKNVEGKILTAYSSQTTAHILDAVKEGSIPNVNDYTFAAYKTLVDIGANYKNAVSFIMQPGITAVIEEYVLNNSLYAEGNSKAYASKAIKKLAKALGIAANNKDTLNDILDKINKKYAKHIFALLHDIKNIDGQHIYLSTDDLDVEQYPMDIDMQKARLRGDLHTFLYGGANMDISIEELNTLYDVINILQFNRLNKLSTEIGNIARVCNPDKFGAKQSIFATNEVFDNIHELIGYETYALVAKDDAGKNVHILEAIFPGAQLDVEDFATSEDQKSKYPPLYYFLKYATANSIIVNRQLFRTQDKEFVSYLKSIVGTFSGEPRLTEKIYNEYKNYVIGYLYRKCPFVNQPLHYNYTRGKGKFGFVYDRGINDVQNKSEQARIHGFNKSARLDVRKLVDVNIYDETKNPETGEIEKIVRVVQREVDVPFKVENLKKPTQPELDDFATLSPAQKVAFIKDNFVEKGIFEFLDVNLAVTYNSKNAKKGSQSIRFLADNIDIETAYQLFREAFSNSNPLVAMAAADLVKYAFVVENYRMGMSAVSKIITNDILLATDEVYGTNIVADMNDMVSQLEQYCDDEVEENFVRSHVTLLPITTNRIEYTKEGYELDYRDNNMIIIPRTERGEELARKYGITYGKVVKGEEQNIINRYVRLKRGNDDYILYRIEERVAGYCLIPLNPLEPNECTDFSCDIDNHKFPSPEYFTEVLDLYEQKLAEKGLTDFSSTILREAASEIDTKLYRPTNNIIRNRHNSKPIQVDGTTQLGRIIIDEVSKLATQVKTSGNPISYIINNELGQFITEFSELGAQVIDVPTYVWNNKRNDYEYDEEGNKLPGETQRIKITKLPVKKYMSDFVLTKEGREREPRYNVGLVNKLRAFAKNYNYNITNELDNVYELGITELDPTDGTAVSYSTVTDFEVQALRSVHRNAYKADDAAARKLAMEFSSDGITISKLREKVGNTENVTLPKTTNQVLASTAKYIEEKARAIHTKLLYFVEDPDNKGTYFPINDSRTLKLVRKNEALRIDFLKTILDVESLTKQFSLINELDIDSEDKTTQNYLNKIKDALNGLENSHTINTARELYIREYIDKKSNDPLIRRGMKSVISGFHSTNWLNAMFNDIQETSNGLVQVTMKELQTSLRSAQYQARVQIERFEQAMKSFKDAAAAEGKSFDLSHVIDKYGRFKQPYNDKFIKDRDKLQRRVNEARIKAKTLRETRDYRDHEYIRAYRDYLRVRLEYNEWKAKHIEQAVVKSYYDEVNKLEREALYPQYSVDEETGERYISKDLSYIYTIYQSLREEKSQLQKQVLDDISDDELDEKIESLKNTLSELRNSYWINPVTGQYEIKETGTYETEDEKIDLAFSNAQLSDGLNDLLQERSYIERKYFKYEASFNFEQELERNLNIIKNAERLNPYGVPYRSAEDLENDTEYQKAKTWIRKNAIRREIRTADNQELTEAYEVLGQTSLVNAEQGEEQGENALMLRIRRNNEYYDEFGRLDPSLMPDDVQNDIKKYQQEHFQLNEENPYSDKTLLNCAEDSNILFTSAFYRGMLGMQDRDRADHVKYITAITDLNNLLSPYYSNGRILWEVILQQDNAEEILQNINDKFEILRSFSNNDIEQRKRVGKFIRDNVKFKTSEQFNIDKLIWQGAEKGRIKTLLGNIIFDTDSNGIIDINSANRKLYQSISLNINNFEEIVEALINNDEDTAKSLGATDEDIVKIKKYVDLEKTKALRVINKLTYKVATAAYNRAADAARQRGEEYYRQWYNRNHVYNPRTHKVEPTSIWMETRYRNNPENTEEWEPAFGTSHRTVRDGFVSMKEADQYDMFSEVEFDENDKPIYNAEFDFINKNYKENQGHGVNYIPGSNSEYDNNYEANEYERAAAKYMQDVCMALVSTADARRYLERGWLPSKGRGKAKGWKWFGRELLATIGYQELNTGHEEWYDNVDYSMDMPESMPMLTLLENKESRELDKTIPELSPRESYVTESDYLEALADRKKKQQEVREAKQEIHAKLLDGEWENAIKEFILKASQYNAIQDNKYSLFFAQQALRKYGVYDRRFGVTGKYKTDRAASNEEQTEYLKRLDNDLITQFDNQIRRVVYDQWKQPQAKLTKWMGILQSMTSAKYMMMNIKGGIANITVGETNVLGEALAREYFNITQWGKGKAIYLAGLHDYIANAYSEKASTKQGAAIKFFDIVDYDEQTGIGHLTTDPAVIMQRIRNAQYTPQTAGEHCMQNAVLITMLQSHRLVPNKRANDFDEPAWVPMNLEEYRADAHRDALLSILDEREKQEFLAFEESLKRDANAMRAYAHFNKDTATEFSCTRLSLDKRREFVKAKRALRKTLKKKFEQYDTLYDQIELKDGKLAIKEGTNLKSIDNPKYKVDRDGNFEYDANGQKIIDYTKPSDAITVLATFKGRVISVNKKIHGVYDKSGRAQFEKTWLGALVTQYHKHLPVNIMKRYRISGMFNEERSTVEKGSYVSLMQFLAIPFRRERYKLNMSDKDVSVAEGIQNIFKGILDFCIHPVLNYSELAEYDKANIRRMSADIAGTLAALFFCMAVVAAGGDDDEESIVYNLALYEADRWATEAAMYLPWVAPVEAKKLWSTPVAGLNFITDVISSMGFLTQYMMNGEDFIDEYQSGKYVGKNKLLVLLENNIPIYRGLKSTFIDLAKNNSYYKIGNNIIGLVNAKSKD